MHKRTAGQNSSGTKHNAASVFLQQYTMPTSLHTSYPMRLELLIQPNSQHSLLMSAGDYLALIILFFSFHSAIITASSAALILLSRILTSTISFTSSQHAFCIVCLSYFMYLKLNVYTIVQYFSGQNICNILKRRVLFMPLLLYCSYVVQFILTVVWQPRWQLNAELH